MEDLGAHEVRGQEVRGKLDALEIQAEEAREGAHRQGFSHAGHALDEDVLTADQGEGQCLDELVLSDQGLGHSLPQGLEGSRRPFEVFRFHGIVKIPFVPEGYSGKPSLFQLSRPAAAARHRLLYPITVIALAFSSLPSFWYFTLTFSPFFRSARVRALPLASLTIVLLSTLISRVPFPTLMTSSSGYFPIAFPMRMLISTPWTFRRDCADLLAFFAFWP